MENAIASDFASNQAVVSNSVEPELQVSSGLAERVQASTCCRGDTVLTTTNIENTDFGACLAEVISDESANARSNDPNFHDVLLPTFKCWR